jgi:uncharacterized protein YqeY
MNPATEIKDRMRSDLTAALRGRRTAVAATLRMLISAIDNREAPAIPASVPGANDFSAAAPSEIERLRLSRLDIEHILQNEIAERVSAAAEMERVGRRDRAEVLRSEANLAKRYLEETGSIRRTMI